jgi:hypothetical protein
LLSKGLKYNLNHECKNEIETLSFETETAINNLDLKEQNYYRHAVTINMKNISQKENITRIKKTGNVYKTKQTNW